MWCVREGLTLFREEKTPRPDGFYGRRLSENGRSARVERRCCHVPASFQPGADAQFAGHVEQGEEQPMPPVFEQKDR